MSLSLSIGVVGISRAGHDPGADRHFRHVLPEFPAIAIALLLTLYTPKIFTSIAFDSGGVASGPMTATFLAALCHGRL